MIKAIKNSIRKFLNRYGYEIIIIQNTFTTVREGNWLQLLQIETIIDVGANEGQFIEVISNTLPGKPIIAFEPIKECYTKLLANTRNQQVTAFNCGLSDINGSAEINVSNNFVSSSLLSGEDLLEKSYPDARYVTKEQITLRRLDDVMKEVKVKGPILVKIDVQGYEEKVIAGGGETLKSAAAIVIEASMASFYKEQWLFDNVYQYFTGNGFLFMGFADQTISQSSGIPLYGDALFIKKELVSKVI